VFKVRNEWKEEEEGPLTRSESTFSDDDDANGAAHNGGGGARGVRLDRLLFLIVLVVINPNTTSATSCVPLYGRGFRAISPNWRNAFPLTLSPAMNPSAAMRQTKVESARVQVRFVFGLLDHHTKRVRRFSTRENETTRTRPRTAIRTSFILNFLRRHMLLIFISRLTIIYRTDC